VSLSFIEFCLLVSLVQERSIYLDDLKVALGIGSDLLERVSVKYEENAGSG
jgi:L-amino acid N-acyltransferase YncA